MCDDTIEEDDGQGNQKLYRVIRVPFRVVFVSGNLKMRFYVEQSQKDGKVFHALPAVMATFAVTLTPSFQLLSFSVHRLTLSTQKKVG